MEDEFKEAIENYIITNYSEFYKSLNESAGYFSIIIIYILL